MTNKKLSDVIQQVKEIKDRLESIVVTSGEDTGIILKSTESPSEYDKKLRIHVFENEYFSELGEELIKLYKQINELENDLYLLKN